MLQSEIQAVSERWPCREALRRILRHSRPAAVPNLAAAAATYPNPFWFAGGEEVYEHSRRLIGTVKLTDQSLGCSSGWRSAVGNFPKKP